MDEHGRYNRPQCRFVRALLRLRNRGAPPSSGSSTTRCAMVPAAVGYGALLQRSPETQDAGYVRPVTFDRFPIPIQTDPGSIDSDRTRAGWPAAHSDHQTGGIRGSEMVFNDAVEKVGMTIDAAGVVVIVTGAVIAFVVAAARLTARQSDVYARFRQQLGRAILLGLELLVAGDIVRTVAASPDLTSVAILAAIVLIRTFLSFSLEVETTGRWPWQKHEIAPAGHARR